MLIREMMVILYRIEDPVRDCCGVVVHGGRLQRQCHRLAVPTLRDITLPRRTWYGPNSPGRTAPYAWLTTRGCSRANTGRGAEGRVGRCEIYKVGRVKPIASTLLRSRPRLAETQMGCLGFATRR